MYLFLDDERDPCEVPRLGDPGRWVVVRTPWECIAILARGEVEALSLDHDLGSGVGTGYDVAVWLEEALERGDKVPSIIYLHTANPVGRARMAEALRKFRTHGIPVRTARAEGRDRCKDT